MKENTGSEEDRQDSINFLSQPGAWLCFQKGNLFGARWYSNVMACPGLLRKYEFQQQQLLKMKIFLVSKLKIKGS